MGSWSPTLFGSDAALDAWSRVAFIAEMPQPDGFYRTPEEWTGKEALRFKSRAACIESFVMARVEESRAATLRGYLAILAVLDGATGGNPSGRTEEAARKLAQAWHLDGRRGIVTAANFLDAFLTRPTCSAASLFTILQQAGLEGGAAGGAEAWITAKQVISLLPDIYCPRAEALPRIEATLSNPAFRAEIDKALACNEVKPAWNAEIALMVLVSATGLMASGAPMTDIFRATAIEAIENDPDRGTGREPIRAALHEALLAYREGHPFYIAEETLEQAFQRSGGGLVNRF